jgi:hypothetical protein
MQEFDNVRVIFVLAGNQLLIDIATGEPAGDDSVEHLFTHLKIQWKTNSDIARFVPQANIRRKMLESRDNGVEDNTRPSATGKRELHRV